MSGFETEERERERVRNGLKCVGLGLLIGSIQRLVNNEEKGKKMNGWDSKQDFLKNNL